MPQPIHIARAVLRDNTAAPLDQVELDFEGRYLRRKVLPTRKGRNLLVDLPQTELLAHGDRLQMTDGACIEVIAAREALIEIRAKTPHQLSRLAYHLGNRHLPVQIETERLLIKRDHVIEDMLIKLGAATRPVSEIFNPEGGAYGHGRTHSHEHPHEHSHEHGHEHRHSHD